MWEDIKETKKEKEEGINENREREARRDKANWEK